jgi:hypothetical protein
MTTGNLDGTPALAGLILQRRYTALPADSAVGIIAGFGGQGFTNTTPNIIGCLLVIVPTRDFENMAGKLFASF